MRNLSLFIVSVFSLYIAAMDYPILDDNLEHTVKNIIDQSNEKEEYYIANFTDNSYLYVHYYYFKSFAIDCRYHHFSDPSSDPAHGPLGSRILVHNKYFHLLKQKYRPTN